MLKYGNFMVKNLEGNEKVSTFALAFEKRSWRSGADGA